MREEQQTIGRYEVTAEVGRGSMGIVHLAHDPVMDRDVAIKTILIPHGLDVDLREEFQERFQREAQAAGRLSHPGIVTVYEFNQDPNEPTPYIAMEYVEGPTLHELICSEGALSPNWALGMADTLAGALTTAHGAGVVHRDLKPANILIRKTDGVAKIADFGVARVNQLEAGNMYGSPAYVAPECIRGQTADTRSDLFSLAVILYETLTGHRPFGGKEFDTICHAITHDDPTPVRRHAADLAPAFDRFFSRGLAKDPAERFQDADSFRQAIQGLIEVQSEFDSGASTCVIKARGLQVAEAEQPASAEPDTLVKRWRLVAPVAGLLVLLSFAAGWGLRGDRPNDAQLPAQTTTPPTIAVAIEIPVPMPMLSASYTLPKPIEVTMPAIEDWAEPAAEPAEASPVEATSPKPAPTPAPVEEAVVVPEPLPEPILEPAPIVPVALPTAWVELTVKNSIKSGRLSVLADGEEIYSAALSADKKTLRKAGQQFEASLEIPAGLHQIVVRAYSEAKDKQYESTIELDLAAGQSQPLTVVAGRTIGRRLTLKTE